MTSSSTPSSCKGPNCLLCASPSAILVPSGLLLSSHPSFSRDKHQGCGSLAGLKDERESHERDKERERERERERETPRKHSSNSIQRPGLVCLLLTRRKSISEIGALGCKWERGSIWVEGLALLHSEAASHVPAQFPANNRWHARTCSTLNGGLSLSASSFSPLDLSLLQIGWDFGCLLAKPRLNQC